MQLLPSLDGRSSSGSIWTSRASTRAPTASIPIRSSTTTTHEQAPGHHLARVRGLHPGPARGWLHLHHHQVRHGDAQVLLWIRPRSHHAVLTDGLEACLRRGNYLA